MALTITMSEGDDVFIIGPDDVPHRFELEEMFSDEGFMLVKIGEDGPTGKHWEIGPEKSVEVLPDVMISEGRRELSDKVRVVFQAPREVDIFRGSVYRERQAEGLEQ